MRKADLGGLNKTRNSGDEYTARNTIEKSPNYYKRFGIDHFSKNVWTKADAARELVETLSRVTTSHLFRTGSDFTEKFPSCPAKESSFSL